ncbi:MAG: TetR/AcrR family transcriptional regulator [Hyphomicrobium sp.]
MPKRSDSYMEKRRLQILDAAVDCITQLGWNRTTIDAVAEAAGLSKGAVYVHFESKRAVFFGLLERNFETIEAVGEIDTFEKLRAFVTQDLDTLAKPDSWRIMTGSLEAVLEGVRDPEIRVVLNRANARLTEILTGVIGRIRPDLTPAAVRTMVLTLALLNDGLRSYRATSEGLSKSAMRAVLDQALLPLNPATKKQSLKR